MRNITAFQGSDLIGLMDQMLLAGGAGTLGGSAQGREVDRSDRVTGVSPGAMVPRSDLRVGGIELGAASLSGAARSERPEAMLGRGSRVTGSGGAAFPAAGALPPAGSPAGSRANVGQAFALSNGASVSFAAFADFQPDRFP